MIDHSIWRKYVSVMNEIVGGDIRSKSRKRELAIGRFFVAYQLRQEGYTFEKIGLVINRHHATAMYAVEMAKWYIDAFTKYPAVYGYAGEIWSKFQQNISENEEH